MSSKAKYHHLIPQTYMSSWANASGTLKYKNLTTEEVGNKNKDNILGINHYHSIFAGMPLCTKDDADRIFSVMIDYDITYQGRVISDSLDFNNLYYDFNNWEITRKSDGTVASKKPIRSAIEQVKIRDIEEAWSSKYENFWPSVREEIESKVLKASGPVPEFQKDFIMKFYVSMDWRSLATEPMFEKEFNRLCTEILEMDKVEIPTDERELPLFETMADYFKHCLLLKFFRRFLNDDGPMYLQAIESMKHTNFHFLIADGSTKFITSDNPSFVYQRKDGAKAGLMPITPQILMVQGKMTSHDPQYYVTHITEEAVERYNKVIEENANEYILIDNSGVSV